MECKVKKMSGCRVSASCMKTQLQGGLTCHLGHLIGLRERKVQIESNPECNLRLPGLPRFLRSYPGLITRQDISQRRLRSLTDPKPPAASRNPSHARPRPSRWGCSVPAYRVPHCMIILQQEIQR